MSCNSNVSVTTDREWVFRTSGMQCEDVDFTNLSAARTELTDNDIITVDEETIFLAVCEACTICPNSAHFAFKINSNDLDDALELGWSHANDSAFLEEHNLD